MDNALICGSCNHENRTSSKFCAGCGAVLEKQCPGCLKLLSATANFCDHCGTRVEAESALRSPEPVDMQETLERRQMTVMFCDLRDSTRLSEQLDPEDLRQVLRLYQDACVAVVQKFGGYVSRFMGDGILVLFGYPSAHDDDAYRAVRAGLDIVSEITSLRIDFPGVALQLAVRIGVATGVVVSGDVIGKQDSREQTIVGKTPNLASRLQSIAGTNDIVVNETTYRLVEDRFRFEAVGPTRLHGISAEVAAFRVLGLLEPASPALPMVGREAELDQLARQWARAVRGSGQVALIQGEAGIGKSRLVQALIDSIDRASGNLLELRCSSYLTHSSLHPLFELFRENRAVLAEIVDRISGEGAKQSTRIRDLLATISSAEKISSGSAALGAQPVELPFDAIVQLLIAISENKPLLLVLDDFHWADPSTIVWIDLLVDRVPLEKIMVVVVSRSESRGSWLKRDHVSQLGLDRLGPEQAEAMFDTHAGNTPLADSLRRIVVEKSDGVPLFIEELTKSILHERAGHPQGEDQDVDAGFDQRAVPETLRDSLMARLDQLGEAKLIAQFGAAIGREFSLALLQAVTNLGDTMLARLLSRLVSSELVLEGGTVADPKYLFKHSLVQDTAYESLLRSTRIDIHRRIAAALENQFADIGRSRPELMARHYALSEQPAKAAASWNLASERALQQSANLEALHHASEGLRCVTRMTDEQQRSELSLSLYIQLSTAISGTRGDAVPEVEDIHRKAAAMLDRSGDASTTFSLTREMHAYYIIRGPLNQAVELGHRMLELAEDSSDPKILTESLRSLGWTYLCHGELEKARAMIGKALSRYDIADSRDHTRHDTIDPGGVGSINLAWAEWLAGKSDTAVKLSRDAIALSREIDHPYTLAYTLCMGAAVYQCHREPEAVLSLVDEAIAVAKQRDYRYWIAWGSCLQAWARAQLGDPDGGVRSLESGLDQYRETGATLFVPHILCMTAEAQRLAGRWTEARRCLENAVKIESDNQIGFYAAETRRILAEVESELGETESSVTRYREALEVAEGQGAKRFELRVATSILQSPFSSLIVADPKAVLSAVLDSLEEGREDADYRVARNLVNTN